MHFKTPLPKCHCVDSPYIARLEEIIGFELLPWKQLLLGIRAKSFNGIAKNMPILYPWPQRHIVQWLLDSRYGSSLNSKPTDSNFCLYRSFATKSTPSISIQHTCTHLPNMSVTWSAGPMYFMSNSFLKRQKNVCLEFCASKKSSFRLCSWNSPEGLHTCPKPVAILITDKGTIWNGRRQCRMFAEFWCIHYCVTLPKPH